ncbi:PRC-barrel domain-containing protein [Hymenobacter properus]|uniref:PRC-barrel domain-containing protein n=1 Tax=Hymenobacter properus TaxID=2791026 RepID=A0A931BHB6_9BACT|nr:PRC-barrel domain-containing protein [Hymenobacter properus]MBF9142476.1 PRC-barrel domain-containing protein [Hymenobacter properus]MBR7721283.1 PRC-barrel domain-containing protein [Microvirga sp. SRT04]
MEAPVLRRLRDLTDFEVADDNPDVRGWTVRGGDGQALGTVYELIVEPEAMKVRYLDVELDGRFHINEHENHILLPIGVAALDADDDNVFVPALNAESVLNYPPYVEIQITREYEEAMLRALGQDAATGNPRFYEQEFFDADSFYSRRRAS